MIWITFVLLLTLEIKQSSTQEYIEVLSLKNIEVKRGEKVATLLSLSKSFKIDFEFCFTTIGQSNNLKGRRTDFFRLGPSRPDVCDLKCERMQICKSKYLYAYFEHSINNGINIIFGNCLAGFYKENYLSINPGCIKFQITQLSVNGTYWSTIKINNTEVSKFQNKHPEEYKSVDLLFSDAEYASQHGVVNYLIVANADCCTLGEWTAWGECSSTCNMVSSVPQQKRIRKCLGSGNNCKGELMEQVRNCNELVFCTDYKNVLYKENIEVKRDGIVYSLYFLSKTFKIDFEFCFTTVGENNNLNKSLTNLFRFGQESTRICDKTLNENKCKETCESRYLTAFFGPAIGNGINLKFGQCLDGTYSEKDLSINPGCIQFQIAQLIENGYYQSIIKVDNIELFNFQNENSKDLQYVRIFFSDGEYASQPGVVKYLSVANAGCCALSEWEEWSACMESCQSDTKKVPYRERNRFCLNAALNVHCYEDSSVHQIQNCNENVSCLGKN